MAVAEEHRYGVHLAKCSAISCACPYVEKRLQEGLKARGVATVVGRDVYPMAGLRSDHFVEFAKHSLYSVIPACQFATESFENCFEKAESFKGRFVVVLSEPIVIPPFLKDFNYIPLYNINETNEYNRLMDWFDKNVAQSLRVTDTPRDPGAQISEEDRPAFVGRSPSRYASRETRTQPLLPERRNGPSIENESVSYNSGSSASYVIEGANSFVSLPSLDPLDHPDSGPTARKYCAEIDHARSYEFKKDLQHGRFHLVFNDCDSEENKRDAVLYALQTFNKRTLGLPFAYAVQLLRCNQENLRLHGVSYIEYKLLRWSAYLNVREFEDLVALEEDLFELLADPEPTQHFMTPQFSHIAGLYMLCLALLRDHFDRDRTDELKHFRTALNGRQFQIDEENERNHYYRALQIISREAFGKGNKGSVACILQFKNALRDFYRDHTDASLNRLKKVIGQVQRQNSMYVRFREARKVERMLLYQVIVRAVVAFLKDKLGIASESAITSEEIEMQSNTRLLKLFQLFSKQGVKGASAVWPEQFKRELRSLLFHQNSYIAEKVRLIVQYPNMSAEEREHVLQGHFSELFSTVGLEWRGVYTGESSKTTQSSRWQHYLGKIGGSMQPLVAGSHVSIILNSHKDTDDCAEMYNYGFEGDRKRRTECEILGHLGESSLITQLYAVNSSPGMFLYVLEMPAGGSLQKFLLERRAQGNWITLQELTDIAVKLILAIEYCHRKQIIHRDIRTENFYYCKGDRTVKLDNFGIASHFHANEVTDVDINEIPTLWSSPETLRDKRTSPASDIWMLAQTIYELFMHGGWPYSPRLRTYAYGDVIYWIAHKGIKPLESPGCIPPDIFRAILSCIEKDEDKRPTASSLLSHFQEIQHHYHQDEVRVPRCNMDQSPYPRLCDFQVHRASKAEKGIPPELTDTDLLDSREEHFVPDPWETGYVEDDDPDISYLTDKTVIRESPLYQHSEDEVRILSGTIPGLARLTGLTKDQEGTTMESEWNCPKAVFLNHYVYRARRRDDSFTDEVIQIFSEVTKALTELHKSRCIHRDICTRHILVDPEGPRACLYRIARVKQNKRQFGSQDEGFKEEWSVHENFSKRVRWFPVEVLQDAYFSFKSDVYMLAVTIWETFNIITRVKQGRSETLPFSNIPPEKLSGHLAKGAILPSPGECCPDWLYDVMKECWSTSPAERPTMEHVNKCLQRKEYIPSFEFQRRPDPQKNRITGFFQRTDSETEWFLREETEVKRPFSTNLDNCRELLVKDPSNPFGDIPRPMGNRLATSLSQFQSNHRDTPSHEGDHLYEQLITDLEMYDDIPEYQGDNNGVSQREKSLVVA